MVYISELTTETNITGSTLLLVDDSLNGSTKNVLLGGSNSGSTLKQYFEYPDCTITNWLSSCSPIGWYNPPMGFIYYTVIEDLVYVWFLITGMANSSTTSFTLPSSAIASQKFTYVGRYSGSVYFDNGVGTISGDQVVFQPSLSSSFPSTGIKDIIGFFGYVKT